MKAEAEFQIINLIAANLAVAALLHIPRTADTDPAIAAAAVMTSITDVVGFISYLGLATIFYA